MVVRRLIGGGGGGTSTVPTTLKKGVVAAWKFSEKTGDFQDSVSGIDFSVISGDPSRNRGPVLGRVDLSDSIYFSTVGTTPSVAADSELLSFGDSDFTICCWLSPIVTSTFSHVYSKLDEYVFGVDSNNRFRFFFGDDADVNTAVKSNVVPVSRVWYFARCWFDSNSNRIGISVNNETPVYAAFTGTPATNSNQLYLARNGLDDSQRYAGGIGPLTIYDRLLTPYEAREIYNDGFGVPYPFNNPARFERQTNVVRINGLAYNTSGTFKETPNGAYAADPIITSRTISGITYQAAAYYDVSRNVIVGVRKDSGNGFDAWVWYDSGVDLKSSWDNHETISIAIDSAGILHLTWGQRNDTLNYRRSDSALSSWTGTLTSALNMGGTKESAVQYQMFFVDGSGNLHCTWRDGASGNGDQILKTYTVGTTSWANAAGSSSGVIMSGKVSPFANPYLYRAPELDSSGLIHFMWKWRTSTDTKDDQDLHHVRWNPSTGAFTTMDGTSVSAPFVQPGATGYENTLAIAIPANDTISREPGDLTIDSNDYPHGVAISEDANGKTQWVHYWYDGSEWISTSITSRSSEGYVRQSVPMCFITPLDRLIIVGGDEETYGDTRLRYVYADSPYTTFKSQVVEDIAGIDGTDGQANGRYGFDKHKMLTGQLHMLWFATNGAIGSGQVLTTEIENIDAHLP